MYYFRRLLDSKDKASIKRFTILVALGLYTVTNFMALFISNTLLNVQLLSQFVEFNFYIIGIGIFGLSVEKIGDALVERARAAAAATILTPSPTVTNVETVEGNVEGNGATPVKEEDDVAHDLKDIKKNIVNSLKTEIIG